MTGEPDQAPDGAGYNPDMSHALLVAVVMKLGGSVDLDLADLTPDAMGNAAGELYHLGLEPIGGTAVRLSVMPR